MQSLSTTVGDVIHVTDSGLTLIEKNSPKSGGYMVHAQGGDDISLEVSPAMTANVRGISEAGFTFGSVSLRSNMDLKTARVWDPQGKELKNFGNPGEVTGSEELGRQWFIGQIHGNGVIFTSTETIPLAKVHADDIALATSVNGIGIVGGYFQNRNNAAVWDQDGAIVFDGKDLPGKSKVMQIIEGGSSFIMESIIDSSDGEQRIYFYGNGAQVLPLKASHMQSLEDFPIVAIHRISPNRTMIYTLKEPRSGQHAMVLVRPDIRQRNMSGMMRYLFLKGTAVEALSD